MVEFQDHQESDSCGRRPAHSVFRFWNSCQGLPCNHLYLDFLIGMEDQRIERWTVLCSSSSLFVLILDLLRWDRRYSLKESLYVLSINFISISVFLFMIYSMDVKASSRLTIKENDHSLLQLMDEQEAGQEEDGPPAKLYVFTFQKEDAIETPVDLPTLNHHPCFLVTLSLLRRAHPAIIVLRITYGFPVDQKIEFPMFEIEKTLVILVLRTHHRLLLL